MTKFDVDLYFVLVEKMMVFDGGRVACNHFDQFFYCANTNFVGICCKDYCWFLKVIVGFY